MNRMAQSLTVVNQPTELDKMKTMLENLALTVEELQATRQLERNNKIKQNGLKIHGYVGGHQKGMSGRVDGDVKVHLLQRLPNVVVTKPMCGAMGAMNAGIFAVIALTADIKIWETKTGVVRSRGGAEFTIGTNTGRK